MTTFRKMNISDLTSIKNILETDFDDFWTYNTLKSELENTNSNFLVAIENDKIIGFAGYKQILNEAELMNIVVRKDMRGKGFGSNLLTELLKNASTSNIKTVFLEVNEINKPAINLYMNFGFYKISIRKNYYNACNDAIIMKKIINS